MKLGEAFPSAFLKADDLGGRQVTVTIDHADMEVIGQGRDKASKLIIGFRGKEKKLVCNKTNANMIASMYGDETEGWIGKQITLVAREVEFQGEMVVAIRVLAKPAAAQAGKAAPRPAAARPAPAPAPAAEEPPPFAGDEPPVESDEIPF